MKIPSSKNFPKNRLGITQKQVKKWFANKRVRSQMCYKPLYRSRKVYQSILIVRFSLKILF